jgi:hypothetical protein
MDVEAMEIQRQSQLCAADLTLTVVSMMPLDCSTLSDEADLQFISTGSSYDISFSLLKG